MAYVQTPKPIPPTTIDKFLGYHREGTGDTQLMLGESGDMTNFYITKNFKLSKIEGYKRLFETLGHPIRGQWFGNVGGTEYHLFACNGHIYKEINGVNADLGTLTDDTTSFIGFDGKVYILNGHEYKVWNGTGSITDVQGYIPKVYVSVLPNGTNASGDGYKNISEYEPINLLTGKKHMTFNGDGTSSVYILPETSITSIDKVIVNGVQKTLTTHYTVDLTNGKVTFTSGNIPLNDEDNVDIYWTKGTGNRVEVTSKKYGILYGGSNDTRIFIYGDGTNKVYFTGLADGIPSAEYFPSTYVMAIGSSNTPVTAIERQYDRLLIYKTTETYYSYYDTFTDTTGATIISFPNFPLNKTVGNVAYGQVQVLNNEPVSIDNALFKWVATNVRDERNVLNISNRIQLDLDNVDLTKALTIDWQDRFEYWLCVDKNVWIYNYQLDVFSRLELAHKPTSFIVINGKLYFGTDDGKIMEFNEECRDFDGATINAKWKMNYYNFGASYLKKTLNGVWLSMYPDSKASIDVSYTTDTLGFAETEALTQRFSIFAFYRFSFKDFSFNTSYNPSPFKIKMKAKKFTYFSLILENNSPIDKAIVLSISLKTEYGGESK